MGNKIRIKQIDLQGVFSSSAQVNLLSASDYVSFVTQLDTTMSTDLELAAVSSSISQSIYDLSRTFGANNTLVSGASQLTSSYDSRYVLSGSITQTTWDNISGKPSGLISQSTDLTSLNAFTASNGTTALNLATSSYETKGRGIISGSSQLTASYDTRYETKGSGILSGSVSYTSLTNIPSGIVSQSVSLSSLNAFTASYFTDSASIDSRIDIAESFAGQVDQSNSAHTYLNNGTSYDFALNTPKAHIYNNGDVINIQSVNRQIRDIRAIVNSYNSNTATLNVTITENGGHVNNNYWSITKAVAGYLNNATHLSFSASIAARLDELEPPINLNSLNTFTSSYFTDSSSFDSRVLTEKGRIDAILSASTANADTFAEIVTLINSVDTTNDNAFATYYTSSNARISSLENATGSYLTSLNGALSSSNQLTGSFDTRYLNTGGDGVVSGSSQLTSSLDLRYAISASYLTSLNGAFSSSIQTLGGSGVYSSSAQLPNGLISGSSQLTASYDTRYATSASYLTSLNGAISSSSQLTSSYDTRYTLSGSVQPLPSGVISGSSQLPTGLVSGSSQLTASYDTRYTLSGSVSAVPAGTISGSSQLTASFDTRYLNTDGDGVISGSSQLTSSYDTRYALSSSYNSDSASFNSRFNGLVTTGSNTFSGSQVFSGSMTVTSGQVIASTITNNSSSLYLTSGSNLYVQNNGIVEITGSIVLNGTSYTSLTGSGAIPAGTISGSSQLTSSFDTRYAPSASYLTSLNGALSSSAQVTNGSGIVSGSSQLTASYDTRYTLSGSVSAVPAGTISGSSQLTASFDTRYAPSASYLTSLNGAISSSTQVTNGSGIISGSSQLTASFDVRYALSGSGGSATIPAGTVSGSSQLTSSYDGRYTLTSSFNSFTASAQAVTTGSNSFNGTQTITGSLIITTGSFFASQLTANTASLYLTSGSNLYVQNNGLVEITGSLVVSGSTILTGSISISSGSITMPNRPAFRVIGTTGDRTAPLTLSGSLVSVEYNEGNYFSTTNGKFTAPTAGLYHVYYNGRVGSVNAMQQVIVYKNSNVVQLMWESSTNTGAAHFGVSGIVKLAVNDTLEAKVAVGTIQFDANDSWGAAYIG